MSAEEETSTSQMEEIWQNLIATDQKHNNFQFSHCRNRHIVVVGPQKTANHIVGDVIRRDHYAYPYHQSRKDEQQSITYIMVPDDATCNVCIVNLIDIPPLDNFVKRSEKDRKDSTFSPMIEVDQCIYRFATKIDLIILVCDARDIALMKAMKKWTNDRRHVMALVMIVPPTMNSEEREKSIVFLRSQAEFRDAELEDYFEKGIYCLSDFSHKRFANAEEEQRAQSLTKEWRSKFLRKCVGGPRDPPYIINLDNDKQMKRSFCSTS